MSETIRDRIDRAISRVTAAKAADSVLAEIGKTHVLIERDHLPVIAKALSIADDESPCTDPWEDVAAVVNDLMASRPTP